ncbi:penicillin-binding protein 1A [Geotalea uraniireducens]|uniref:peptidoglycan glycosyltransferase n=1 Tax=Geotalea uraniireducens TaxID=351604 RepID=A0ABN6VYH5_9BACT|nr:PBP1A family penicillin-binding protein [Geotalea uraniireducens]BDV44644.1 penicillin-binding protein 1A [Geotalea uraniireducens]
MVSLSLLRKEILCRFVAGLFLLLLLIPAPARAQAQDRIAAYPLLPAGYSSIRVFDRHGRFVGRILPEQRYWVPLDRIPVFLQRAVVAVEDARFYEHGGIDMVGIARALVKDVVKGKFVEGGSTITQQLIKNLYLSGEKTLDRKVKEGLMAIEFEKKYTKQQILEMYFNRIYYGNGAWGIAQAARLYFDKNPDELSDAECALLAGIPKNPVRYNPLGKAANVATRRDVVLRRMVDQKIITARQRQKLRAHPVTVVPPSQTPRYLAYLRGKLIERYGAGVVDQGGLEVTAALDLKLQKTAEKALHDGAGRISPTLQGALLCLDPTSGDVLAAVGGVEAAASSYNRVFAARRQPGSAIKPLLYAAALDKGLTASSIWSDAPETYNRGNGETWRPENYGRETFGELTLRQALAYSNNVIAVKVLETIGVPYFVDFARKMGVSLQAANGLSLALGTADVSLNDMVLAYAPLATGGSRPEERAIIRIFDRRRRTWTENPPASTPVLAPATAFVTTQMLKDVLTYGTAKALKKFSQRHPAAGKTGTTSDYRDAWFIGYTPQLITGVWLGYDKPKPGGKGFTGGVAAAPIWERFMRQAVADRPSGDFPQPPTVVAEPIDPATGCLAAPGSPDARQEYYLAGTEPTTDCSGQHGAVGAPQAAPQPPPAAPAPGAEPLPAGATENGAADEVPPPAPAH